MSNKNTNQGFIHIFIAFLVVIILGIFTLFFFRPTDYESCMKFPGSIGYTSIPPTCNWFFGSFTRQIDTLDVKETTDTLVKKSELNTDNWKTYTDEKYSYTLKYRPDLKIVTATGDNYKEVDFTHIPEDGENESASYISTLRVSSGNGIDIETYIKNLLCDAQNLNSKDKWMANQARYCVDLFNSTVEPYSNNNVRGIKAQYNPYESQAVIVAFERNGLVYSLSLMSNSGNEPSGLALDTLEKIISTFEFID